jgi:tetratricopeptide (TPR) repeat protein
VQLLESVLADPKPPLTDTLKLEILYHQLSPAYTELGVMYVRLGDPRQALSCYEKGQKIRDDLPRDPAYLKLPAKTREENELALREDSARSLWAMGDIYYRLAEPERGAKCLDQTLAIYRELLDQTPASPISRQKLLGASSQAGYWRFVSGQPDEARPLYEQSLDLATKLAAEFPAQAPLKATLSLIHYRMGVLLHSQQDPLAKEQFDACLRIRAQLAANDPTNDKRKLELLLVLARLGRQASATRISREVLSQVKQLDIELLLDLARAYAQCSVADPNASGAEAHRINALYAIRQAIAQGHQDKVYLRTEPDFQPLRDLPEFQQLVAGK